MTRYLILLPMLGYFPGCEMAAQMGDRRWHHLLPFGGFFSGIFVLGLVIVAIWLAASLSGSAHHRPGTQAAPPALPPTLPVQPAATPAASPAPPPPPAAPPTETPRPAETALDILKIRYAKGELTREQFEQMRKDIE